MRKKTLYEKLPTEMRQKGAKNSDQSDVVTFNRKGKLGKDIQEHKIVFPFAETGKVGR